MWCCQIFKTEKWSYQTKPKENLKRLQFVKQECNHFNKLCAHMYVTTKCYIGQMLEACLETTKAKTLRIRGGNRVPESQLDVSDLVQRRVELPLKRYLKGLFVWTEKEQHWYFLFGGETTSCFGLKTYYILITCVYSVSPGVNEHTF